MRFLRLLVPGWVFCAFKGHRWTLAQIVGCRLIVRWCPTCDHVEWID